MAGDLLPFDDRDGFIWYDGRLVPWRDAKLHVLTHGLHYASCVFEGERVYGGKAFHLDDHNARLINSAKILGFEIPASMDDLTKATMELIAANKIVDGYVRPVAWRGADPTVDLQEVLRQILSPALLAPSRDHADVA